MNDALDEGIEDDDAILVPRRRHGVRIVAIAVVVPMVLLAVALAKGLNQSQIVDSPLLGKPAPRFSLPLLDGDGAVDNVRLTGSVYVVNFWASWCVPCRKEAPILEDFSRRWAPAGVTLIGILFGDTVEAGRKFRDEFHLTYPQVDDPEGRVAIDYGVSGVPETFVIDGRGIVMAKIVGAVGPTTLDDFLTDVAAGRTVEQRNKDHQPVPSAP